MTDARHVGGDTLAEYAEGLLEQQAGAAVADHLRQCARCTDRLMEITNVSAILAAQRPVSMPPEVAGRIDAALAEAARTGGRGAEGDSPPDAVSHARGGFRARRRLLAPLAAAVIVLLALGGVFGGKQLFTSHGDGAGRSASAPGRGTPLSTSHAKPRLLHSGTDYRPDNLASRVRTLASGSTGGVQPNMRPEASSTAPTSPSARQAGCIARISRKAGHPSPAVVDVARYRGRPATVLVYRNAAHGTLDVWVVSRQCSSATDGVLNHRTVPGR